jgi:phosphoribosylaminoimidazole carboxylase PurE protein
MNGEPGPGAKPLTAVPDSTQAGEPATEPATETLAETAAEMEQIDVDAPRVAIVVAEREDLLILERAETELQNRGITAEVRVMSASEEPRAVADYTENAQLRGIRVIIAGAGPEAKLPAMITAHTELPVIGVPLTSQGARTGDLDALLSGGGATGAEPVAWVALDDATGAAILAARILST